jgi:hypothetical protein
MTDLIDPERRWIVENLSIVKVGGTLPDPDGRPVAAVTVRMPAFVAAHLAAGLAVLSEIEEMMTRSSYDQTEMVQALRSAVGAIEGGASLIT